jgi:alanine racemase
MIHQAHIEVDLGAVRRNALALQAIVGPGTRLCPVIKANAYGHGLAEVAAALADLPGRWGFAIARGEEALALRAAGIKGALLVLGPPPEDGVVDLAAAEVTLGLGSAADLGSVTAQLAGRGLAVDAHLKVNTGMCRMGVEVKEVAGLAARMRESPVRLAGIYSHFATAEAADPSFAHEQLASFHRVLQSVAAEGLLRHIANSAGLVRLPAARLDLVRPGAILYGLNPGMPPAEMPRVQPALRLVARVAEVKTLPRGCTVGYGRRYRIERPSTIVLVPVGYADGYSRALGGVGDVLIGGRRAPVVGAVNMDSITVDVTDLPPVRPGDEVVLLGPQGEERVTVEELAERGGTIPHEVPTRLGSRLPRIYVGGETP